MASLASASSRPASPAVDRALALLQLLAVQPSGMSLSELSRALGEAKSSLHGVLSTMEARGFVVKHPDTKEYRLGAQVLVVGAAYERQTSLVVEFHAVAAALTVATGETVQLALLQGRHIVYVAKHEGTQHVRLAAQLGGQLPAHATALGKVLLSELPPAVLDQLFAGVKLEALTRATITELQDLKRELAGVREAGFARDRGEVSPDLRCVAAPVRDASGTIVAALSVSVPITRLNARREREITEGVVSAAAEISARLGFAWLHRSAPAAPAFAGSTMEH